MLGYNIPKNIEKILITPTSFGECSNEPLKLLSDFKIILNPYKRKMTPEEVVKLGKDCIGIIAGVENINEYVLSNLSKLKCISRVGVGIDNIDLKKAEENGIKICNTPDGPTIAVAELTIGLILSLLRKIHIANKNMHNKIWKKEMGFLLSGKTIGIIGVGRIGRTVAKILQSFGCKVISYDINPDIKWLNRNNIINLSLKKILSNSDIICLHLSYPKGKDYFLNHEMLDLIKRGSYLINMSRGNVVDEKVLVEKLQTNHISGAAIDVYEKEPYEGVLCTMENVILAPHIGSYARESRIKMEIDAVKNLLKGLSY